MPSFLPIIRLPEVICYAFIRSNLIFFYQKFTSFRILSVAPARLST